MTIRLTQFVFRVGFNVKFVYHDLGVADVSRSNLTMKLELLIIVGIVVVVLTGCDSVVDRGLFASTEDVNTSTSKQFVESPAFMVTATAAEVLHGAARSDQKKYVRATCNVGGCSGFVYDLQTTNDFDESADRCLFLVTPMSLLAMSHWNT